MFYVLDASAMLAYLRNEPGAEIVEDALTAPDSHCSAHSINLCEVQIQQGEVDALWVKETDRLSRPENLGDLSLISETLATHDTELIVDSRTFDLAEDTSVLMLDFEGVLAKRRL